MPRGADVACCLGLAFKRRILLTRSEPLQFREGNARRAFVGDPESPVSTENRQIETDFWAEHWKSKNATRFETGFIGEAKIGDLLSGAEPGFLFPECLGCLGNRGLTRILGPGCQPFARVRTQVDPQRFKVFWANFARRPERSSTLPDPLSSSRARPWHSSHWPKGD